ncbi:SDR family NAD(P)-dependent oxidoreductase [Streptomyces sp. NPDC026673]|uniref:SDR family NAD(P)-dependent oxidoreductase n=1 Tax=Streptomyces sp. NPDC026673 TaxID=3155724 RepID=UPI0033F70360
MTDESRVTRRSVAITGAGSGLGRDLALALAGSHRVFGTTMSDDEAEDVTAASNGRVTLTVCDITDRAAVARWAGQVADSLGAAGLDALVGNAAVVTPGPLELLDPEDVRREFEVNVFGAMAVINAFLPALRRARGRIVQIGSTTAAFPLPFLGMLGASKAAMDTLADAYRMELRQFGVDFVVAVPGSMRTGSQERVVAELRELANTLTDGQRALYGESFGGFVDGLRNLEAGGMTSEQAVAEIAELIDAVPVPARVPVGEEAEEILRLVRESPDAELDALRMGLVGLTEA